MAETNLVFKGPGTNWGDLNNWGPGGKPKNTGLETVTISGLGSSSTPHVLYGTDMSIVLKALIITNSFITFPNSSGYTLRAETITVNGSSQAELVTRGSVPGEMIVDVNETSTVLFADIEGSGIIEKRGTGRMIITWSGTHRFTGKISVKGGGTLQLGGAPKYLSSTTIQANIDLITEVGVINTLEINVGSTYNLYCTGVIRASTGTESYENRLLITKGTLVLSNNVEGTFSKIEVVNSDAKLQFGNGGTAPARITCDKTGTNGIYLLTGNNLTLNASTSTSVVLDARIYGSDVASAITLTSGTLILAADNDVDKTVNKSANIKLTVSNTNARLQVGESPSSLTGNLCIGTISLDGNSTFTVNKSNTVETIITSTFTYSIANNRDATINVASGNVIYTGYSDSTPNAVGMWNANISINDGARMQVGDGTILTAGIHASKWVVNGTLAYNLPGQDVFILTATGATTGKIEIMAVKKFDVTSRIEGFYGSIVINSAEFNLFNYNNTDSYILVNASTITLNGTTVLQSINHRGADPIPVTINSVIAGTGNVNLITRLTYTGSGVYTKTNLILNGNSTCTGTLTIPEFSSAQVGSGGNTGSVAFTSIAAGGTFKIHRTLPTSETDEANKVTLPSELTGQGPCQINGYVVQTGNNKISTVTIDPGATLQLSGSGNIITNITVNTNATLGVDGTLSYTNIGIESGGYFNIGKGGAGGNITSGGTTTVKTGAKVVVNRASPGTATPTPADIAKVCVFNNLFGGSGTITIKSPSYVVFAKNNSAFSGTVEIESGAYVQDGNPGFLDNVTSQRSFGGSVTVNNNGTFVSHEGVDTTWDYLITGSGSVENRSKSGLIFTKDNTYTGNTITYGGAIIFGNGGSTGGAMNSPQLINTVQDVARFSVYRTGHLTFNGSLKGRWSCKYQPGPPAGATNETLKNSSLTLMETVERNSNRTLAISGLGDSTDHGSFTIVYGRLSILSPDITVREFNMRYVTGGLIVNGSYLPLTPILEFICPTTKVYAGLTTSGPLELRKSGPGELVLLRPTNYGVEVDNVPVYSSATVNGVSYKPADNSGMGLKLLHFGNTTIKEGTLTMQTEIVRDNTMALFAPTITASVIKVTGAARIKVENGGAIGGLTVASGGILAPGNSPGLQTMTENLTLEAGAIYEWELANYSDAAGTRGSAYDAVDVGGTVTIDPNAELHIKLLGLSIEHTFWDQTRTWDIIRTPGKTNFSASFQKQRLYIGGVDRTANVLANNFSDAPAIDHLALSWVPLPESVPVVFIGKLQSGANPSGLFDSTALIPGVITEDNTIKQLSTEDIDTALTPIDITADRQAFNASFLGRLVHGATVPMALGTNSGIEANGLYQTSNTSISNIYLNILGSYGVDKNMLACYYIPPGEAAPITPREIRQLYILAPNTTNTAQIDRGTRIRLPVGAGTVQSGSFSTDEGAVMYNYPSSTAPFTASLPTPGALAENRGRYGFILLNKGWQLLRNLGTVNGSDVDAKNLAWSQIRDICRFSQWRLNSYAGYLGPNSSNATDNTHYAAINSTTIVPGRELDVLMMEDLPLITTVDQTYHGVWFEKSDRDYNDVVFALEQM
jgi:hypothetical protein